MEKGKSPLTSKTLWANAIAIGAMVAQGYTGFVVGPEYQAAALGIINLVLRTVTRERLDWGIGNNQRGSISPFLAVWIVGLMLLAMTPMSGCTALQRGDNDPMAELVVRATTARLLAEHPTWTGSTILITGNALMMIDGDPLTSLDDLQQAIVDQIDWGSLVPEEQALLQILITRIRTRLEDSLTEKGMTSPGQYLMPVKQLLLWINQTAALKV